MAANLEVKQNARKTELDILRCLSMAAVVALHVIGTVFWMTDVHSRWWHVLNVMNSATRWCVPLFVMISGALFLGRDREIPLKTLYGKYILRIVSAFLIWSTLYALWDFRPAGQASLSDWLRYAGQLLVHIALKPHYHLWFVYMIVGLYILLPVLRVIVRHASQRVLQYWLLLMAVWQFGVLALNRLAFFENCFGSAVGNMNLGFLTGYVFYFVCGYYLTQYRITSTRTFRIYCILGISAYLITVIGTAYLSLMSDTGQATGDSTLYDYMLPTTAMIAVAIFAVGNRRKNGAGKARFGRLWKKAAEMMFGVYLIHDFYLIILGKLGFTLTRFPHVWAVFVAWLFVCAASIGTVFLLRKIPFCRKYMM